MPASDELKELLEGKNRHRIKKFTEYTYLCKNKNNDEFLWEIITCFIIFDGCRIYIHFS